MDDDAEKRIADLERQLAEARAAAADYQTADQPPQFSDAEAVVGQAGADEHGVRYAEALWEGLRTGAPAGPGGPSVPEITQLREALSRAAAEAGMSPAQLDNALRHGSVTIKGGSSVVYPGQSGPERIVASEGVGPIPASSGQREFGGRAGFGRQRPRRKFRTAGLLSTIFWASIITGVLATMLIPSSALWMSGIMCSSPYHLAHQSTYSNGHGDSVSFQCVSDAASYRVNEFAIMGLQAVIALPVLGVGAVMWRRLRKPV